MNHLIKTNADRTHWEDSWKQSWYAFYPYQTYFGKLTGFSEDIVAGGRGFGMHPHQNMEIVTIPVAGAQTHRDSTGNVRTLDARSVQLMSAGTGLEHAEMNASAMEPFRSFQIWVMPEKENVAPRYESFSYQPADKQNRILTVISPDGRDNSLTINQRAFFSLSHLTPGAALPYVINQPGNGVYIHVVTGSITADGHILHAGDAIGIWDSPQVALTATVDSDLIFVETPVAEIKF